MKILFESQGGTYQKQGDYFIPCVVRKICRLCLVFSRIIKCLCAVVSFLQHIIR